MKDNNFMYSWSLILNDKEISSMSRSDKEIKIIYKLFKNGKYSNPKKLRKLMNYCKNINNYDLLMIKLGYHLSNRDSEKLFMSDDLICKYLEKEANAKTFAQFVFLYEKFFKKD